MNPVFLRKTTALILCVLLAFSILSGCSKKDLEEPFDSASDTGAINVTPKAKVPENKLSLTSDKSCVLIGKDDTVYFYVSTELTNLETVDLYAEEEVIATMYDDGDFSEHGDDMAGDGIYSACVLLSHNSDTTVAFKASGGKGISSNSLEISYYTEISEATLLSIDTVNDTVQDLTSGTAFENKPVDEKKSLIETQLSELEKSGHIMEGSVIYNEDAKSFSFQYPEGILGCVSLQEFDSMMNGSSATTNSNQYLSVIPTASSASTSKQIIGTAIILNSFPSFETEQERIEFRSVFYQQLESEWDQMGLETTLDTEVTISDYLNIDNYNVICIATHGGMYAWYDFGFIYQERPAFCLSEQATKAKNRTYSKELKDKQIGVSINGEYCILPDFFTDNFAQNAFENSFVFSESCQSFGRGLKYDYTMANAFINRSAKDYIGFHNSVFAEYSRNYMKTYVNGLIKGDTTAKAYQTAINTHGANHELWYNSTHTHTLKAYIEELQEEPRTYVASMDIASPNRQGKNNNATLLDSGLKNGGFESFDTGTSAPSLWMCEGDVRTVLKLGEVVSKNKRMVIITTGVGAKNTANIGSGTEGSLIKQTFIVPTNVTKLSFDYNFVSEEPMEYVGSSYNDSFGIQILQNGSVVYKNTYEDINSSTWIEVKDIDFSGGDDTVYQTGWKSVEVDVSQYQGKVITLCFTIYDMGDSQYDSACVIDNIQLK